MSVPERLKKLQQDHPKRFEYLINDFTEEVILDVKDDALMLKLAKALYESQKRVAIERDQAGEVADLESSDNELIDKYKKAIVEKYDIQQRTLAPWIEYIRRNDAGHPSWFLYYVIRSLKDMGQFSRDEIKYSTRTETTIAPFPEMNAEALAFVKKSLTHQLETENIVLSQELEEDILHNTILDKALEEKIASLPKDKQEQARKGALRHARNEKKRVHIHKHRTQKQQEYLQEVSLNEEKSEALQEELFKRLDTKNFSDLYAFAQVETAGNLYRESLVGEWIRYPKGSNHRLLEKGLIGKGTGWCTAEGSAQKQLEAGDFYVFYTNNKTGVPTEPRIAIRMANDVIEEIRGVDPRQELEPELVDTAKAFYKNLPGSTKYEKADSDMKRTTTIYNRCTTINKETKAISYHDGLLTRDELIFLYEVDIAIEGFGYAKDPRIEELRSKRNRKDDIQTICNCASEHIAHNFTEITEQTLVYCEDDGKKIVFFDYRKPGNQGKLEAHIELAKKIKETGSPARPDFSFEGGIVNIKFKKEKVRDKETAFRSFKEVDNNSPSYIWPEFEKLPFTPPHETNLDIVVFSYNQDPSVIQSSEKIVEDIDKLGYRPPTFEEMTIAGIYEPKFTKTPSKYFVGLTPYQLVGASYVPSLCRGGGGRRLDRGGWGYEWVSSDRFLCVRK